MTAFERLEPRLPELLDELAAARVPDYLDDMLRQAARTRQRPPWSSLERWLPMEIATARGAPLRAPIMRPILLLLLLGLLIAAGAVAYVGTRSTPLPAPFGPARNGTLLVGTIEGDIAAVDPATGSLSVVVGGQTEDVGPSFTNDGRQLLFVRETNIRGALWIANADGSGSRELVPEVVDWFDAAPAGDRLVVRHSAGQGWLTSVIRVADGSATTIELGMDVERPVWRPNHDQIIFGNDTGGERAFYVVNADGSSLRRIPTARGTINDPVVSPDGSMLAYATWEDAPDRQGRIHVVDIDTGVGRELVFDGSAGTTEFPKDFSPDGTKLLLERYGLDPSYEINGSLGYRLVVVPAGGGGPATVIGPAKPSFTDGVDARFSPDGTMVIATYRFDLTTMLLDATGGDERSLPSGLESHSWQRLAP